MTSPSRDVPQSRNSSASGSDSKQSSGAVASSGVKKRPSRAGTRSVLERKRANDREAQRAIRQRTKEHIDKLERRIAELSSGDGSNDQLLEALKRIKELEEENSGLRASLEQAHFALAPNWEEVPTIKIPTHAQHGPIATQPQQQMQTGTPAPTPREASSFSQIPGAQWRSSSQFHQSPATPRSGGGGSAVDAQQQQQNPQWQSSSARPPNPPEHITTPRSALTESAPDYGYMMHSATAQQVRSNSHPSLQQQYNVPQAPPQQPPHASPYGQMSHDQQMMMMQERNQRQQSQPPLHGHQMRATGPPEQPIFYAPYTRQ
ncbi:MAG: hypothetical protein M1828_003534 [Chrysothrix sp. TS-e1954]|nr:MAG: hypothetical protein M1828_003534 [Chrysothrix sp. TS-e1954]